MSVQGLIANRSFVFLWWGQILSQLADRILVYVLLVTFYRWWESNLGVSLANLSFAIPAFLFSAIFGVFVDHYRKKRILILTHLGRGILVLFLILFVEFNSSFWPLFMTCFFIFTIAQMFAPAETSIIPELVTKKNLVLANGLFMGTWMGATVFGFAVATPITEFFSLNMNYVVISVCYFIAAFLAMGIKSNVSLTKKTKRVRNVFRDLWQGLKYLRVHLVLQIVFFQLFFGITLLACIAVLGLDYVETVLNLPHEKFGILVSFAGIGMLLGILLLEQLKNYVSKLTLIRFGFLFAAISLWVIGVVDQVSYAYMGVFGLGLGNAFVTVPIQTIIQESVLPSARGRMFGIQNLIIALALTLPPILLGYLSDEYGIQAGFLILAALAGFIFLIQFLLPSPKGLKLK